MTTPTPLDPNRPFDGNAKAPDDAFDGKEFASWIESTFRNGPRAGDESIGTGTGGAKEYRAVGPKYAVNYWVRDGKVFQFSNIYIDKKRTNFVTKPDGTVQYLDNGQVTEESLFPYVTAAMLAGYGIAKILGRGGAAAARPATRPAAGGVVGGAVGRAAGGVAGNIAGGALLTGALGTALPFVTKSLFVIAGIVIAGIGIKQLASKES